MGCTDRDERDIEHERLQREAKTLRDRLMNAYAGSYTVVDLATLLQDPLFGYGPHHLALYKDIAQRVGLIVT